MDDRSPGLTPEARERPPAAPERRAYRRHRPSHALPIVLGILLGAAAIAIAVVVLRSSADDSAAATTSADTPVSALPTLKIVFPEGFTREEMARRIGAVNRIAKEERGLETALVPKEYLAETRRSSIPAEFGAEKKRLPLEGFLFPATYEFTTKTTAGELVGLQLVAFRRAWSQVDLRAAEKRNLTPYDVLIIASMIEAEVRVAKERALVAAVIYNRLRAGMTLGIDSTIRYGLDIPPDESITQSQLEQENPYNTRRNTGLPPTPIGNPGLASMKAAAKPAAVDYLYFARKKDCRTHFFTESQEEFLAFLDGPRC